MARRRWNLTMPRWCRKARDSICGSARQLWEKIDVYLLPVSGLGLIILFLILILNRLQTVTPREQYFEREMENLELIHSSNRCSKQ